LELSLFSEGDSVADFTAPDFSWMLTAHSSLGFDPLITNLQLVSLYEANYTVSNVMIGSADLFFDPALAGDFDADGDVDGADFLRWQLGESPNPFSASDLAAWQADFGMVDPPSTTLATVPEPSASVLLLLGLMAQLGQRRVMMGYFSFGGKNPRKNDATVPS
jgi:hypothetical protein